MRNRLLAIALLAAACCSSVCAQIFYRVEGNGLEHPSYILGTHHLAPMSSLDSIPGLFDAFRASSQVLGEIDMTTDQMTLAMKMQPYMTAPADSTLSKLIPADVYERINEEFKKWAPMPGMELSMFEPVKPMVVNTMVAVAMVQKNMPEFNPQEQLDMYFQLQGRELGKEIKALETAEQQAKLLYCSTPLSEQANTLVETLDNPDRQAEMARKLNEAYAAHDIEALFSLTREDDSDPEFFERLLNRRNASWLEKLPGIFGDAPTFMVVGALHLPGEAGVLEGLRKAGYTVTAIE